MEGPGAPALCDRPPRVRLALALPLVLAVACDPRPIASAGPALAPAARAPERPAPASARDAVAAEHRDMSQRSDDAAPSPAAPSLAAPSPAAPSPAAPAPARAAPPGPLELAFVGDIILGKYVLRDYADLVAGRDPFGPTRELLDADVLVGNLETPLVATRPARSPIYIGYRFGADAEAAKVLARAGFDALSVANNHALDLLREGLEQTPTVLRDLDIAAVGGARADGDPVALVTLERAGWRIGLLAATSYVNTAPGPDDPALPLFKTRAIPGRLAPHLRAARADHHLLIVLLHWGQEFAERPDAFQRVSARELLGAGADLVIGHHPHVLQGVEVRDGGLVAYSLGNFLFANTDERSRRSGVLRVRYDPGRRCPARASFHPVWLGTAPAHTPEPAAGKVALEILGQVQKASKKLGARGAVADGALTWTEFPACDAQEELKSRTAAPTSPDSSRRRPPRARPG